MTTESMPSSAYVALDGDSYRPSSLTRGPWHPDHQHAGPPIALMCRAIENAALKLGLTHLSRLTANLLRPVPIRDVTIEVITNYVGRNSGHFSAQLKADDKEVALVTALAQRENGVELPDDLPGHPLPFAPRAPDDSPPAIFRFHGKQVGYADLVDTRMARGALFKGPCAIWFRLQAFVPEDGQSLFGMLPPDRPHATAPGEEWLTAPLPVEAFGNVSQQVRDFMARKGMSQPTACFSQSVKLTGGIDRVSRKTYIYCNDPEPTTFTPFYEKLKSRSGWTVGTLPCTHFVQMDMPNELTALLKAAA